jgi:hypothetical protein
MWAKVAVALAFGTMAQGLSGCDRFYEVVVVVSRCEDGRLLAAPKCDFKFKKGVGELPLTMTGGADGTCPYHANEPPSSSFEITVSASGRKPRSITLEGANRSTLGVCLDPL